MNPTVLMVRSLSYLENGPFLGITSWFYMPYFKPTIDFNILQYIISSDSLILNPIQVPNHFNALVAGLLVDFKYLNILERSNYTMHAII